LIVVGKASVADWFLVIN